MNNLRSILRDSRYYFIGYLLFFLFGLTLLLTKGNSGAFLYLNPYHQSRLDTFFTYYTWVGDGVFAVIVILLLLSMRRRADAMELLTAFLLSALLAQIFKNLFSMPRPREFFNNGSFDGPYKNFIQGVTLHGFSSFPSGHSTSVFTLMTSLAIFEKDRRKDLLFLLVGLLVGYSRIYLGQHFMADVLAGSFLGLTTAVIVHLTLTEQIVRLSERIGQWRRRRAE